MTSRQNFKNENASQYLMRKKARQHLKIKYFAQLSVSWQGFMQWGAAHNIEVQVTIHICSNKIFLKENCED